MSRVDLGYEEINLFDEVVPFYLVSYFYKHRDIGYLVVTSFL